MRPADLLQPRPEGLYCPPGDFFIDPSARWRARSSPTAMPTTPAPATARCWRRRETLDDHGGAHGRGLRRRRPRRPRSAKRIEHRRRRASASIPPATCWARRRSRVEAKGARIVVSGDYKRRPDPTCAAFEPVPCDVFITEATFGLPVFRHPDRRRRDRAGCCPRVAQFPERTHLVGAYALGKAQRVIALLREAG